MNSTNEDDFTRRSRTSARAIQKSVARMGHSISLQQAYDVLAASVGHNNWATMKAKDGAAQAVVSTAPDTLAAATPIRHPDDENRLPDHFSMVTAPGGPAALNSDQLDKTALLVSPSETVLVVAKGYEMHPLASAARSLLRRKGFAWDRSVIVERDVLSELYAKEGRWEERKRAKELYENSYNPIHRVMVPAKDYVAVDRAVEDVCRLTRVSRLQRIDLMRKADMVAKLASVSDMAGTADDVAPYLVMDNVDNLGPGFLLSQLEQFMETYPGPILLVASEGSAARKVLVEAKAVKEFGLRSYAQLASKPAAINPLR